MRKHRLRKSTEASQILRLCSAVFVDCKCTLDGLCQCVVKINCPDTANKIDSAVDTAESDARPKTRKGKIVY